MAQDRLAGNESELTPPPATRRMALLVEYEGAEYAGFQLQLHHPTVQGELEKALQRLTKEHTRIRGASRTDSGAHALRQVVDFETGSSYPPETFVQALNYYLPADIRILCAAQVQSEFNSRRDAESRTYRYQILNRPRPSALRRRDSHWIAEPLNVEDMNLAAQDLVGEHDFRSFAPAHPADRSAVRQVYRWDVARGQENPDTVLITCEANGFMQHQIRRTNAVLAAIGKGSLPVNAVKAILNEGQGNSPGISIDRIPTLPAKGLCMVRVKYKNPW